VTSGPLPPEVVGGNEVGEGGGRRVKVEGGGGREEG